MQQVLIACPVTGDLVPGGVQVASLDELDDKPQLSIGCLGCGGDHEWVRLDATLAPRQSALFSELAS